MNSLIHLAFGMNNREKTEITTWRFYGEIFPFFRCFSTVGRTFWKSGFQKLSLSNLCQKHIGTIIHELLHTLGFWHEQSREDRDDYVEILWENIAEG